MRIWRVCPGWVQVADACNPSYLRDWHWKDHSSRSTLAKSFQDPIFKLTRAKWTRGMAQAVEGLLWKCEALSSNPSPTQKKFALIVKPLLSLYFKIVSEFYIAHLLYKNSFRKHEEKNGRSIICLVIVIHWKFQGLFNTLRPRNADPTNPFQVERRLVLFLWPNTFQVTMRQGVRRNFFKSYQFHGKSKGLVPLRPTSKVTFNSHELICVAGRILKSFVHIWGIPNHYASFDLL
jgi:hypothetical protein